MLTEANLANPYLIPSNDTSDFDADGIPFACDVCRAVGDELQQNSDADPFGDACDKCQDVAADWHYDDDIPVDGIGSDCDNCPFDHNPEQANLDNDAFGDLCDRCPGTQNQSRVQLSEGQWVNLVGIDAIEAMRDFDSDQVWDVCDNCIVTPNQSQTNIDSDDFGDACDRCQGADDTTESGDQSQDGTTSTMNERAPVSDYDADSDGVWDNCEAGAAPGGDQGDADGDGLTNLQEQELEISPTNADVDGDGLGDGIEVLGPDGIASNGDETNVRIFNDVDGDSVGDGNDNCRFVSNPDQADTGGVVTASSDGVGNVCQCGDVNNNGQVNSVDALAINRAVLNLDPFTNTSSATVSQPSPTFLVGRCNVHGSSGNPCNATDGLIINRVSIGLLPPPILNICPGELAP